jgi:hypothetical protein
VYVNWYGKICSKRRAPAGKVISFCCTTLQQIINDSIPEETIIGFFLYENANSKEPINWTLVIIVSSVIK